MNILVYDTENYSNDIYDMIGNYVKEFNFSKTKSTTSFTNKFTQRDFDFLIIDVSSHLGEELFQDITKTKPLQKIIAISKNINYNSHLSCEDCAKRFNRKLLLKPIQLNELIKYIKNYDSLECKFSGHANSIREILGDVMSQFVSYQYDKQTETITKKPSTTKNINELISITEILNTHDINYSIDTDDNISLH